MPVPTTLSRLTPKWVKKMFTFSNRPQTQSMQVNNGRAIYPSWDSKLNAERYSTIDDVYSIIRLLATTSAMIPLNGYKVKDKEKNKSLKRSNITDFRRDLLFKSSLDELDETNDLHKLLNKPNPSMGRFEFYEALYTFLFMQGECILYKERVEFGATKGKINGLHYLYPQFVEIVISNTFPYIPIYYNYVVDGQTILQNVPVDDIIHINYFNPKFGLYGNEFRGLGTLKVLSKTLTRLEAGRDASVAQMQNGGVPGIVWQKGFEGSNEDATEVLGQRRKNFYHYIKNSENKGMPFFAAGDMGYIELGLKLADLEVAELAKIDFKKLCNAFGVSDILFNNGEASTESNVEIMMKRLYTSTVLPNVMRVRDAFINGLDYYTKQGFTIEYDLSDIKELQADMKTTSEWLSKSWWITLNEKRIAMKYDKLEDNEIYDQLLIPNNLQTMDDLEFNKDIDADGDYRQNQSNSDTQDQ
jgi:HK97 family phage portal protein